MFTWTEWVVLYAIVGFAYSLMIALRLSKGSQPITKDMIVVMLAYFLWPWVMLSYEVNEWRRR